MAGRLGWAGAGLSLLSRGFKSPRALVDAHRVPQPPYLAGVLAASAGAHAMLDVSDGLMSDLGHIAAASMVNIDVESARVVIDQPVQDAASAFNADPLTWVLAGETTMRSQRCSPRMWLFRRNSTRSARS